MATIQRQLVNLEILAEDLNSLSSEQYGGEQHIRLIEEYKEALEHLSDSAKPETESGFKKRLTTSTLAHVLESKQMIGVHLKLIGYVLTFWDANKKANDILDTNFGESADKRLELLQVKAIRAKGQLKTVAHAMGQADYQKFIDLLNLRDAQWQWDVLLSRY